VWSVDGSFREEGGGIGWLWGQKSAESGWEFLGVLVEMIVFWSAIDTLSSLASGMGNIIPGTIMACSTDASSA
jgi:hypothetical protein